MEDLELILKEFGAKNRLEITLDENGSCTLEFTDGRLIFGICGQLSSRTKKHDFASRATWALSPVAKGADCGVLRARCPRLHVP